MSDQYVGEIRMFSGNYAPQGWHFCDGSILSISENEVLYTLLGTTYGGDGRTTFALPDMRGRIPLHTSSNYPLGQMAGTERVTLLQSNMPAHTHTANANNVAANSTSNSPVGNFWGVSTGITNYQNTVPNVTMSPATVSSVGGNQPHDNIMPSKVISFIIALVGIFPSQG
ncbi:MAG: tail fiber protein [Candidatus Pristimantibacillus lignocellulolyticus]|uniref:Tail fiber protein n=1 Tax=Candidatus Pristimantibacillus lignocellulolyticus TaxID=2994561 RepID=A0A9J6ZG80_9BACL|nr:MAG: tail fiber protein [Candidatus Pristimantibacillus lignocellulolyticus]